MSKTFTWILLHVKMFIKKPVILGMIILIPICGIFFSGTSSKEASDKFSAGVYVDGNDDVSKELCERLLKYDGIVEFKEYTNLDDMYRDVKNSNLASGIILPDDLTERTVDSDCSESIISIIPPGSTIQGAINEVVYAELIAIQGRFIIADYVDKSMVFLNTDINYIDELMAYYDKYLHNSATFSLIFSTYGINGVKPLDKNVSTISFPFRGIVSIIIFLVALIGIYDYMKKDESGCFAIMKRSSKEFSKVLHVVAPTFVLSLVALISFAAAGDWKGFVELGAMAILILMTSCFSIVCGYLARKSTYLLPMIFIFTVGALVFCPVFVNMEKYLPAVYYIEKIFAPYYYLRFFM